MEHNFDYLKNMLDPNLQAVYYTDDNTEQFLGMYDKSENKFYSVHFYEDYDPDCPKELKGLDNVSLYNFYTERIYDSPDISFKLFCEFVDNKGERIKLCNMEHL